MGRLSAGWRDRAAAGKNETDIETARGGKVPAYPTMPGSKGDCDEITFGPDEAYADDFQLEMTRGSQATVTRLSKRDVFRVQMLLTTGDELAGIEVQADHLARSSEWETHGNGMANTAAAFVELVGRAHAAGYALCADDYRQAYGDAGNVANALEELLLGRAQETEQAHQAAGDAVREMRATHRTQAVRDVIAMLRDI
jgi:hypothetical protein